MSDSHWPRDAFRQAMWDCPNLSASERALLQVYAEYARDGVEAWVVSAEMTRRSGIRSRSTIERTTKSAVAKGWLALVRPATMHRAAVYRITIPADCEDDRHTALCPNLTHKGLRLLVSKSDAQALVSKSDDALVSKSDDALVSKSDAQSVPNQFSNQSGRDAPAVAFVCEHYGVPEQTGLEIWKRIQAAAPEPIRSPLKYARQAVGDNPAKWHQPPRPPLPSVAELVDVEPHEVTDSSGFRAWRKATPEAQAAAEAQARAERGDDKWFARACELIGAMP